MPPKPKPIAERLWAKIEKRGPDDCWPWLGATNASPNARGGPYGKLGDQWPSRKTVLAHRVVYSLEVGAIPVGFQVDHQCGYSLCCNPRHLEAVEPAKNNERSTSPTSRNIKKTHCPQGHEYSPENTGYRKEVGYRYCRACARLAQHARRGRGLTYTQWLAEYRSAQE
jgi:hypothetical protein